MTENPSSARRRRKEIIALQRCAESARLQVQEDALPPKKRKVSEDDPTMKGAAKIPAADSNTMTEEQAGKNQAQLSSEEAEADCKALDLPPGKKQELTTKKGKTQFQYDPGVPMAKDQLAAWRREARRVRNRESAAASRQKIRNRIEELEVEVDQWKVKFNEAMSRIQRLEDAP